MSYTVKIKEEISKLEGSKSETIAELSAYIRNNGNITRDKITMTTENKVTVDKVTNILKDLYLVNSKVEEILKDLGIWDNKTKYKYNETVPDYIVGGNEEIRGYLRGVFLSVGSVNDPKASRYHMELLVNDPNEAVFVQKLLNIFDLNAKILNRDKGYMIYIKEAEKISDFLKILGATKAVLYFEDVRIYRDQKNKTNRLNNCEQANIDKIIQTAEEQLRQIEIIEENDGVTLLDDRVKVALEYRKKYPEASLKELAEIISMETNKPITKSGLNHRLRKIKELSERFEKQNIQ